MTSFMEFMSCPTGSKRFGEQGWIQKILIGGGGYYRYQTIKL